MTTTEMTTTEVGEILVRIDPAENWYASLSRAAVEAEQCGLGLRLVFTAAPQQDPSPAGESRGATTGCGDQSSREVERCGEEDVPRDERGNG
ncbi:MULTISPECIES: hypothetical protein [unclassified Streptomyces]|uniref:hypothetical protein n=1 Tax=unclassified Streptomyces TaxID=2593676 RepID=UPI00202FB19E|nr:MULTISPECIES: hypothetical protein [unclassified Streptomyces]MCM1973033.1 hypothetical protein [Streptomyces sp. G1]MCX5126969.1 hypothetical protein [Streptomyces sp. NBC_00347]